MKQIKLLTIIIFFGFIFAQTEYHPAAEKMPELKGGIESVYKKIVYPKAAKDAKIQGRAFFLVYVNTNGKVDKVETVKGLGYGTDEEAVKALKSAEFIPGQNKGIPVNVKMAIAINFKID